VAVDVGARIRAARKAAGLTQEAVAYRAGVTAKAYGDLERGTVKDPHYSTLLGIAEAVGVPVEELVREEGKVPAPTSASPAEEGERREPEGFDTFIERWREYIESRVSLYEALLAAAERGAFEPLKGHEGAEMLVDIVAPEFTLLPDVFNGELFERWLNRPDIPEGVKAEMGRRVGEEVLRPFAAVVGLIGSWERALARTEAQKRKVERRERERRSVAVRMREQVGERAG
jgi:transcriptional regulator with XRE-family HTH domain